MPSEGVNGSVGCFYENWTVHSKYKHNTRTFKTLTHPRMFMLTHTLATYCYGITFHDGQQILD